MAATEVPDKKSRKYDRQLRLWGPHGQRALEEAHIALLNASVVGCETLKNLILPGIGRYTVVDGKTVSGADAGANFFLHQDSIGQPRAKAAMDFLQELNSDGAGAHVESDPVQLIADDPAFFNQFTLVIATEMVEADLLALDAILRPANIPLIICRAYGMIGYTRMVTGTHCMVEAHPDNAPEDLRLTTPFPELQALVDAVDLEDPDLPSNEYTHIPFPLILIKLLGQWKEAHDGNVPSNRDEKNEFKAIVKAGGEKYSICENFEEASKKVFKCFQPNRLPSNVRDVFAADEIDAVTADSENFWVLAKALREFTEQDENNMLPLIGSLPDMTATNARYVELQRTYKAKAEADLVVFRQAVERILTEVGREADAIGDAEIRRFVKNSQGMNVYHFSSLAAEMDPATAKKDVLAMNLGQENSPMVWYMMLRAADRFYTRNGNFPGVENPEADKDGLKECVTELLAELELDAGLVPDEAVGEMCRFGAAELHGIASFVGGIASQEIVKIVTYQYEPMLNTYVYDGITSNGATCNL